MTGDKGSPELPANATETTLKKSSSRVIMRFAIFGVVLVVLITTVVFFSNRLNSPPTYSGGKVVGKLVPDVTVKTLDGKDVSLRSLAGKRVMINFFNSWCIPCQEEEPALQEFARNHANDPDFVFIGIARDDSDANIRAWVKTHDEPFDVTLDHNEDASIAFGTTGQPETYAIDSDGQVVASLLARASVDSLEKMWDATQ